MAKPIPYLVANGCWAEFRTPTSGQKKPKMLFLDRDGVVIEERHYLKDPDQVSLIDGSAEVIRDAARAGWTIGLITNQAGIGRGLFDWQAFADVQTRLHDLLAHEGAYLDFVLACPYHAQGKVAAYTHADHPWRKPNPGMIEAALHHYGADRQASTFVGDRPVDIIAASRAQLGAAFHVLTGHGESHAEEARTALAALDNGAQCHSIAAAAIHEWIARTD